MFLSGARSFVMLHVVVGAALLAPYLQGQGNDSQPQGNNAMFPAVPAAASSIGWQGNYFVVKGKPTILWSGSIHYARIPRELWRERLIQAKRAGINTIQTYVFWNAHEPQSGVFNFSDNLDLDAWLKTIEEVGLYSVVRMGPYNGGEWLQGGTPQWITAQPGMQIRKLYPPYLSEMDQEYKKLLTILARHQIHKGGSLLFVQLDNEYTGFPKVNGGTDDSSDGYLTHLYKLARAGGIEVPLWYSGLNHGRDPAGKTPFGDRTYPWYSTEFWTGWFDIVGELDSKRLTTLGRGAWHVVAYGGAGASFYMFNGGTNFGYSGCCNRTSYDYGAQIGEAGQFREAYFTTRAPQAFSQAFQSLLATSKEGSGAVDHVASGLITYVRQSPANGTAVFLDNPGSSPIQTQVTLKYPAITFPAGDTQINVAANEIRPVVTAAPWTPNATLQYLAANVLGKLTLGERTYYVLYGRSGELGEVAIQYKNAPKTSPASEWNWDAKTKVARATFTYPVGDTITELPLESGDGASATFLVVNASLANRTWITDREIFVGATNVTEDLAVDVPLAGAKVTIYSSQGRKEIAEPARNVPTTPPAFGDWRWRDAAPEAAPGYDDSHWAMSTQPEAFGIYGFENGYGWYRSKFKAATGGNVAFTIAKVVKFAMVFVNGEQVELKNKSGSFNAIEGENTIAILAWHNGIDTIPIGKPVPDSGAGIWGGVTKTGGEPLATTWRFRGGLGAMTETALIGRVTNWASFLGGDWAASATVNRPSFWMSTIKSPLQPGTFVTVGLSTKGLSSGSVWVNGHNIGHFSGDTLLYVPESWLAAKNTVVIYDVSGNSPKNVQLQYIERRARYATATGRETPR
jgi:beta-galactosidase